MNEPKMMTVEEAQKLRVENELKLVNQILPLFAGYAVEEVVGAILNVSTHVAMNLQAERFNTLLTIKDLTVSATFTVEPVNFDEASAAIQQQRDQEV
ncbi:hypothetical protein [Escherichia phage AV128]|jgi:hypothetical protein|uniref:Uncharacterized protein n=2 Tax=Wifcevirus TaxID=2733141 RepID=A0A9X9P0C1_9CAUD|nr:hypothetical protein HOV52_gp076 [Escherichia phage vB_EcoM_WFC]EAB6873215.1 hypothetical protein [Escherichia coli]QFG06909.1 hypothetical protein vBEco4M7_88 [Escherichia phage vB_Eco4M-7]UYE90883.1 hypothetical protein SP13_076 [Escherichia phage vB_EcoM_SP13]WAQ79415.1 hypothetical protein F13_0093 [Escherichia phage F13]WPK38466.1 hypothetical protein [Escherichia phage AV128]